MDKNFAVHIVDDDAGVRESMKLLVQNAGYSAYCYATGQEFLDRVKTASGCALIDLRLGDMDGLALQQELAQRRVPIDVVIVSAYGDIAHAVKAMHLGAADFVEKPFDPEQLLQKIGELSRASQAGEQRQREARQHAALIDTLTEREKQVLTGIVDGRGNKQVASDLGISARTVETHRVHIMQKLQADSLAHLVRIWLAADPQSAQARQA